MAKCTWENSAVAFGSSYSNEVSAAVTCYRHAQNMSHGLKTFTKVGRKLNLTQNNAAITKLRTTINTQFLNKNTSRGKALNSVQPR